MLGLCAASIAVLVFYRMFSVAMTWKITKNWKRALLQIFDIEMFYCVIVAIKLRQTEPGIMLRQLS